MTRRLLYSIESNSQMLDGGAMFGNAPRSLWENWVKPDKQNRIPLKCRCLLIKDGNKRILLETGIGAFFSPKYKSRYGVQENEHMLLKNLEKMGLSHTDIDVVVLSHLHFDHAGGLLSAWKKGQKHELLFPNAIYVVSQSAYDRALSPHYRDKASFIPELQSLLIQSKRLELVSGAESQALGPSYRLRYSDGHTPGLLLTEIPSSQGPILFASDLIPGRAWVHRSITMGYDRFPELLIDEKMNVLNELVQNNGRLFFTHDMDTAMARITKDEQGRFGSTHNQPLLQAFEI
ncbi:MAG: MBL fold metallo-hydrolase [Myxococcota bacterium]